ncbi:MAG: hypothetical protein M3323_10815 [Actinomycetota bacterium]|nr:hypothetical protein [Actinomycetota bacterium]
MAEEAFLVALSGAAGVVALIMLEWTVGLVAAAAWTQSWGVVKRGHFRITGYTAVALGVLAVLALRAADGVEGATPVAVAVTATAAAVYLLVQYSNTDLPAVVAGAGVTIAGLVALGAAAGLLEGWPAALAAVEVVAGAALLGAVTNGMLLGHWYLNQPGLKPWALARLTTLALVATAATGALGLAAAAKLAGATTEGAVLGIPGFGDSFGLAFFLIWLALVAFTGGVVWAARRCVSIKSIQSATGLYYVALLTAGVSEFLVRYLMVNAA